MSVLGECKESRIMHKVLKSAIRVALMVAIGAGGMLIGHRAKALCMGRKTIEDRVVRIEASKPWVADMAKNAGGKLAVLVFKHERMVEVHAPGWTEPRRYPMTGFSGTLGPKLCEGDGQIPEGVYGVEYLNPNSSFHLSLKVSYPNVSDKERAATDGRTNLGGDIMIHGGNATVGCIPIGDDAIEELFCVVAEVGKNNVSVIIAPYDMRNGRQKELETAPQPWYGTLCDEIAKSLEQSCDSLASPM